MSNTSAVATIIHATSAGTISFLLDRGQAVLSGAVSDPAIPVRNWAPHVGANRTAKSADRARNDLQMTAITGVDANSVYIPVLFLQISMNTGNHDCRGQAAL